MSILTDDQIAEQLASLLDLPRGDAARLLESVVALLRDSLLAGHELTLADFLTLQVVEEKARLVQLAGSATRVIEPPRNSLVTTPLDAFEQALAAVRLTPILLVVPENDLFADIVKYHFTEAGWQVDATHEPEAVADRLRARGGHLVIVDGSLPGGQALLDRLKTQRATNPVPTIALYPRGRRPATPEALRVQADQELIEPFEVAELLACAERELCRAAEEELLFDQQVRFVLPATAPELERATELMRSLLATSGLDEARQTTFHAAVREAIGNAVQHGSGFDPAKAVHVQYLVDPRRVTLIVRDEGPGFDHRRFLARAREHDAISAARDRAADGGRGGLGILMMVRAADRVDYNDKGTVVTLGTDLRPPAEAVVAPPAPPPPPETDDFDPLDTDGDYLDALAEENGF